MPLPNTYSVKNSQENCGKNSKYTNKPIYEINHLGHKRFFVSLPTQAVLQTAIFWLHKSLNNEEMNIQIILSLKSHRTKLFSIQ